MILVVQVIAYSIVIYKVKKCLTYVILCGKLCEYVEEAEYPLSP